MPQNADVESTYESMLARVVLSSRVNAGSNTVRLEIDAAQIPSGSYYATSISFSAP